VLVASGGATLSALGALAELTSRKAGAPSAAELQQLEVIAWCSRALFPAVREGEAAAGAAAAASGALLDGLALTSPAAMAVAAALYPSSAAHALPERIAAYVAAVQASAPFTAAAAAAGAVKGGKGGEGKAEEGAAAPKAKAGKVDAAKAAADAVAALSSITTTAPVSISDTPLMTLSVLHELNRIFTEALHKAFPGARAAGFESADVVVNQVATMVHHYQCNSCLALYPKLRGTTEKKDKKAAKTTEGQVAPEAVAAAAAAVPASSPVATGPVPASPRAVADALIAAVLASGPHAVVGRLEASGPGYINVYLPSNFVSARLAFTLLRGVRASPAPGDRSRRVIVDYSSPNIAKDMHIGHLRSTIIGDAISRMLEFAGHSVTRVNHVGDWGTQFGMLIAFLKELLASGKVQDAELDANISDLTGFYKAAKVRFDGDAEFKERAHGEVVALQAGEAGNLALWNRMVSVSSKMFAEVYTRLGVDSRLILRGESFYNPLLASVLSELSGKGLLKEEPGPKGVGTALVQWVEGSEVPLMLRKADGGFGYDSTDMAAIRYRLREEKGEWLIYVVDAGQSLHFDNVFKGAIAAGWYDPAVTRVEHVGFGVVLGEDGKKFKTRDGGVVRLTDVLDEAKARAAAIMAERGSMTPEEVAHASSVLGYGGVKYFDLRQNRLSDYQFSYDRMLSPDGDTAVYIEYAHARISSILRKARDVAGVSIDALLTMLEGAGDEARAAAFTFAHPADSGLAAELLRFQEVVTIFQQDVMPHRLAEYCFFLCGKFSEFFRDCPVLADFVPQPVRDSRLRLCEATVRTLATGLRLLGIEPLDKI